MPPGNKSSQIIARAWKAPNHSVLAAQNRVTQAVLLDRIPKYEKLWNLWVENDLPSNFDRLHFHNFCYIHTWSKFHSPCRRPNSPRGYSLPTQLLLLPSHFPPAMLFSLYPILINITLRIYYGLLKPLHISTPIIPQVDVHHTILGSS